MSWVRATTKAWNCSCNWHGDQEIGCSAKTPLAYARLNMEPRPLRERRLRGSIVFDMKDTSEIPAVAEPWFLAFNAKVSFRPIMNPQDLAKAGPSIGKAAEEYGQ